MTTEQSLARGSSSSILYSLSIEDRQEIIEEDRAREKTKDSEELVTCRSVGELIAKMCACLRIAYPEARRDILAVGASRAEGALLQTMMMERERGLRKPPIAWFRATLGKGKEWSREEILLHMDYEANRG